MSFKNTPCHVWAIDGYIDDERANLVDAKYISESDNLTDPFRVRPKRVTLSYDEIVKRLVSNVRSKTKAKITTNSAIIYGGFRGGQKAPEHMWVEFNGRIYDTMPEQILFSVPATPETRNQPFLERAEFRGDGEGVGEFATCLTENQSAFLVNTDPLVLPHVGFGPGVDFQKAENAAITIQSHIRMILARKRG